MVMYVMVMVVNVVMVVVNVVLVLCLGGVGAGFVKRLLEKLLCQEQRTDQPKNS